MFFSENWQVDTSILSLYNDADALPELGATREPSSSHLTFANPQYIKNQGTK